MCNKKSEVVFITKREWRNIEVRGSQYQVSNDGLVRSLDKAIKTKTGIEKKIKGKILKQRLDDDGYPTVTLGKKGMRTSRRVHRLVAEAFIPNPEGKETVNHIDFDRTNNHVDNLEWLSHHDNILHSVDAGRFDKVGQGEDNGRAILTEKDVMDIRKRHKNGETIMSIAKDYGRGWQTINHIVKRTTWTHIA